MQLFEILPIEPVDIDSVDGIERDAFPYPWTRQGLITQLEDPDTRCRVANVNGTVVGYILWKDHGEWLELLNLAVSALWRREGIGSTLIRCVIDHLLRDGSQAIECMVWERNTQALVFLRANGFKFRSTAIRPWPAEVEDDGYVLQWRPKPEVVQQIAREAVAVPR